jgi:hypothetical protein
LPEIQSIEIFSVLSKILPFFSFDTHIGKVLCEGTWGSVVAAIR